jgi:hypothetical protein
MVTETRSYIVSELLPMDSWHQQKSSRRWPRLAESAGNLSECLLYDRSPTSDWDWTSTVHRHGMLVSWASMSVVSEG